MFENNGYSEHTGASYGTGAKDLARRIEGFGLPVFHADGFDFFSVYNAVGEALAVARNGGGPAAIYCETTRYFGHFEGDPMLYRAPDEVARFRAEKDCLKNFRGRVTEAGLLKMADLADIDEEIAELIERSVADAKAATRLTAADLLTNVYAAY
jgi:pyruvate dehydrogenase E1 component alpha subunit